MGFAAAAWAYLPEPKSMGPYEYGKGTKSSEQYESTAGMPIYEYGKGLQLGPVHIKPIVDYRYQWDNNVFYEENGRRSDFSHLLTFDTLAELPFNGGQHLASLQYVNQTAWFQRYDSQDHTNHTVRGDLALNFVPFTVNLEDTYERTVSRANTEFTERIQRDENVFRSLVEVPFASFFLENELLNFTESYDREIDQTFDHNEFTDYQRIGYELSPATQILLEYGYENIDYTQVTDRDGDAHQIAAGLRGNLTELISYQAWAGVQFRMYDEESRPDFTGLVVRSAIIYQPTTLDTWSLTFNRNPQESTFDNQSFYVQDRGALNWRKQVAQRVYLNSRAGLAYNEYSRITVRDNTERTRRDYVWYTGVGLEYLMPNDLISFVVNYDLNSRDSNLSGLDYDAQTVSAGVKAQF